MGAAVSKNYLVYFALLFFLLKMEQNQQNQDRSRLYQFLETLATRTHLSSTQARVGLAKKKTERSKLVKRRRRNRDRIRELTKTLQMKEAEISLVEEEIQRLAEYVQDGTDQSSDEND